MGNMLTPDMRICPCFCSLRCELSHKLRNHDVVGAVASGNKDMTVAAIGFPQLSFSLLTMAILPVSAAGRKIIELWDSPSL